MIICNILKEGKLSGSYDINGWVKSFRNNRFIALNDGSCLSNIQCVIEDDSIDESLLNKITIGSALHIKGTLSESLGSGQTYEIIVSHLEILGTADTEEVRKTILSPKKHSLEKLREQAHLRVTVDSVL